MDDYYKKLEFIKNLYRNLKLEIESTISSFAYSELYMTDIHWPAFREEQLLTAVQDFQNRERRFGKTSKQVKPS